MNELFITVTSKDQNPCDFVSNFIESININDGYEVALMGIFHGPLYNIDEKRNKFTLIKGTQEEDYRIPPGYYESTPHLMLAIYKVLKESLKDDTPLIKKSPTIKHKSGSCFLSLSDQDKDVKFLINRDKAGETDVLQYFGYYITEKLSRLEVTHEYLGTATQPTFIYSNIVGESMLDSNQTRLLACAPLKTENGYCHHEFDNPSYLPLRVNSFTDISFQMRDVNAKLTQIAHKEYINDTAIVEYPTIMRLHVRKRQ